MLYLTILLCQLANVSPPPSLFSDARSYVSANVGHSRDTASKKSAGGAYSSSDTDEEDGKLWVQCDLCHKWRLLPRIEVIESHQ